MDSSGTEYKIAADKNSNGIRLDRFLAFEIEEISRSYIQKLIECGNVYLNGKECTSKKEKVYEGQSIVINIPPPQKTEVIAEDIPLDIVYEDDEMLVVNKPKGMVVHPAAGNPTGTLVNALMHHCGDNLSSINGVIRPGIVHRIDKDTSGLLMVAKTDKAHICLSQQLSNHSLARAYRAVVLNNIKENEGIINEPIGRDPKNRLRQAVVYTNSREAVTEYKVLERMGKHTLIEARLKTGRTHQIRVHLAHIKHPLLGDGLYGPAKNSFGAEGQMLHAYLLGFVHPTTDKHMEFFAPDPKEFERVLNKVREKK